MRVGRGRYSDHARTSTPDRFVEIGECLRHPAAPGTLTGTFGIRTHEAHDFEACGS